MTDLSSVAVTALDVLVSEQQLMALEDSIAQTQALLYFAQIVFIVLSVALAAALLYLIFLRRRLRRLERIEAFQSAKKKKYGKRLVERALSS